MCCQYSSLATAPNGTPPLVKLDPLVVAAIPMGWDLKGRISMAARSFAQSTVFKYFLLLTLTLNTAFTVLLLRASKFNPGSDGRIYISATAIFLAEIIKFLTCLTILVWNEGLLPSLHHFYVEVLVKWRETAKLLIPASLYMIQNNLLFVAVKYIDPATYQITYQMKILTTALCMVFILNKRLRSQQWISLLILTTGVALVQLENLSHKDVEVNPNEPDVLKLDDKSGTIYGLVSIGIACVSSAVSGVYYEKLVKSGAQQSVVTRNLQLTLLSIPLTYGAVFATESTRQSIGDYGFLQGYTSMTWIVVICQAFGGLLVAVVVKYTDNILKGFATSISIVICTIFSIFTEKNMALGPKFVIGTVLVILASYLYNRGGLKDESPQSPQSRVGLKEPNMV